MHEIEVQEPTGELADLLARVEAGEEIVLTRAGRTIARVMPVRRLLNIDDPRAAADAIRTMSVGVTLGGSEIRDLIDQGRR